MAWENLEEFLTAWVAALSFALLIIALVSYKRSNSKKILFVGLAFGCFFLKGIYLSYMLFFGPAASADSAAAGVTASLFDTAILFVLYYATMRGK